MTKTAALIVIGNEILSGKVQDVNSPYFCQELRKLGVNVRRISVIADDPEEIGREVSQCSETYDYVLTSGGVGPTHDDLTILGIARGFGQPVRRHPDLEGILRDYYMGTLNEAQLKLCEVPQGATLLTREGLSFPVIRFRNVYVFPGIPEILRKKFEAIKEQFREAPFFLRTVFLCAQEDRIAHYLTAVLRSYPNLEIGSYPEAGQVDYQVKITMESKDQVYLDAAYQYLCTLLPAQFVVRSK